MENHPPAPHPHELVKEHARRLLYRLDGRHTRPEAAVLVEWLGSNRWYMVSDAQSAARVWNDLSVIDEGPLVQSAVDIIIELTMRVVADLYYYQNYELAFNSFVRGQSSFARAKEIHRNVLDKLPGAIADARASTTGVFKEGSSGFNRGSSPTLPTNQTDSYEALIGREPWIMVCSWLLSSGLLQELAVANTPAAKKEQTKR